MLTLAELQTWVGREVYDPFDHRVGVLAGLRADQQTGAPEWLVVAVGEGELRAVPVVGAVPRGFAVRVTPSAERVAGSPPLPAEDDMPVEADRRIAEHYGLVFDTTASASGIPRRPEAIHDRTHREPPGGGEVGDADRARLVDALRRAHAMEQAALEELATAIWEAEDEELVHDLTLHHKETNRHAERLRERLWMLRANRSKTRDRGSKVRAFFGSRARVGSGRGPTERARALLDLERREIDAYLALERLAREVGDPATERLARENRADEEAMASTLRFGALRFAEQAGGSPAGVAHRS
jgi:ferritin-like metal-binding protein YciE